MGFNISGIVINQQAEGRIPDLAHQLGLSLIFEREITFQEAAANWKDDHVCDVYAGPQGTLFFLAPQHCVSQRSLPGPATTLLFIWLEYSMAFNLVCTEGADLRRAITEFDGQRRTDRGTPWPEETQCEDTSELIWTKLDEVLGEPFGGIDPETVAYRYRLG